MNPCTNTSVGILVWRDEELLLIKHARPPYGWAPPTGHLAPDETYPLAAQRALGEEAGLYATHLVPVHARRYCRRPEGEWHDWVVFEATATGDPIPGETRYMKWMSRFDLDELAMLTLIRLTDNAGPDAWWQSPGLQPVWLTILRSLGAVT